MKTTNEKKNKHMTITDRQEIKSGLKKGLTFKTIAGIVKKDPTTISKEVKKHFEVKPTTVVYPDPACKVCPKLLRTCSQSRFRGYFEINLCVFLGRFLTKPSESNRHYSRFS